MYDWTEDRSECILYMLEHSDYTVDELSRLSDSMLTDMVRYDLDYKDDVI